MSTSDPHPCARVTVLGSTNMDLVVSTDRLPEAGETILGSAFHMAPGGKGSNQAVAAARAGAAVNFLGAVGSDTFALELRQILVDNEVGTQLLREVEGPSGVALITVDGAGENRIIVVGDANSTLTELTDDERRVVADAEILLCQLEIPLPTVGSAARHAKNAGTLVLLNPSPVQELPDALVESVDILVVNAGEAEQLGDSVLARVPHVITTLGGDGAVYRDPQHCELRVPTPRVDVVDTTGAGDAFTGTLAACWHLGAEVALRKACAAGALASTRLGATASLPNRAEIDAVA